MDKKTGVIIVLVVLLAGVLFMGRSKDKGNLLGGSRDYLPFLTMASTSRHSVTTTSSQVVASSTFGQYLAIVNDGSNPVYLSVCNGDKTAIANEGIRLNSSGGSYEMIVNDANFCNGAIRAISTGGTSNITIMGK